MEKEKEIETTVCPNNCSRNGICQANGTCLCNQGYISEDCSIINTVKNYDKVQDIIKGIGYFLLELGAFFYIFYLHNLFE